MKHAYLIVAHHQYSLLQRLLDSLDDIRNDIYIHIDKKSPVPFVNTKFAGLFLLDERIDIKWGDISQIEATLLLLKKALGSEENYDYLHLLSGQDLPLKSQDFIHNWFKVNQGKEFIRIGIKNETSVSERRWHHYHLFPHHFKSNSLLIRGLRGAFIRFQYLFGIRRNRDVEFKGGSNWFSITSGLAVFFLSKEKWIRKVYSHTFCPDESVLQTIAWHSPFKHKIADNNLRYINWKNGSLFDITSEDLENMIASNAFFARKFGEEDRNLLDKIVNLVSNKDV